MLQNPLKRKVVLTFMAHPDDAEMCCAGTLIRLKDAGWEIHIATVTPGDCGTMIENRWDIASIRTREAKKAADLISATYYCLGEPDGMVVYDRPALRKSIDLFRRIAPSLVITHPRLDYHMDHEQTHLLARAASFVYAAPNISEFPRHPDSRIPYLYHCDPSRTLDHSGNPVTPTTIIDISKQIDKKIEMLACHASQRDWLRAHNGTDQYIEAMKQTAAARGKLIHTTCAEAFTQHRGHTYPTDDLLAALFK